jgi:hypothetical protein
VRKIVVSGLAMTAVLGGIATAALAQPASAATGAAGMTQDRVPLLFPPAAAGLRPGSSGGIRSAAMAPAAGSSTTENFLYGVSCYTTATCLAVGGSDDSGEPQSLAESWNGSKWTVTPGTINVPSGTVADDLASVSCRSATRCVAVGAYGTSTSGAGLAEVWDGSAGTWTYSKDLTAAGEDSGLNSVSCVNTHQCVAVGQNSSNGETATPAADVWNGTKWTRTAAPKVPGGAFYTSLFGVSCWTGTNCIAVGVYETGSFSNPTSESALTEKWNGSSWTIVKAAKPSGNVADTLNGISCLSAADCTAVGNFYNASDRFEGFGEQWNGSAWKASTVPWSSGSGDSTLYSVSCLSSGDCNATGVEEVTSSTGAVKAAAVHWSGAGWKVTSPAAISGDNDELNGVSCKAANFCSAVGAYGSATSDSASGLSAFWNDTKWKLIDAI